MRRYKADELPGSTELGELDDGMCLYEVDGHYIRNHVDVSFVGGGCGICNQFIAQNEIWVEEMIDAEDEEGLIVHEVVEYLLERYGKWEYEKAHQMANSVEALVRKNEDEDAEEETETAPEAPEPAMEEITEDSYGKSNPNSITITLADLRKKK